MKSRNRHGVAHCIAIAVLCITALLQPLGLSDSFGEPAAAPLPLHEKLRLGERMYREGILPSGEPMQAYVKGDLPVPGTAFTCVSCHLRSGLGSIEGGVYTPPTNGAKLYQPLEVLYKGFKQDPKYFPIPPRRPAYTDETLTEALRSGVDPTGRQMNDVMPRYLLENEDMAIMISYLKSLSSHDSPGISDTTIHFATVISDEVNPEDRDAMLTQLEQFVRSKNNLANYFESNAGVKSRQMTENMLASKELATRRYSLSRWVVKGPPETWRRQLEEYNRQEPVFALLGGMTTGTWKPVHQFCEENRIPCLFPQTDLPVVSETDWYTLYQSKGYYQEGEGAARYLNGLDEAVKGRGIVQIVRDSDAGKALSTGFLESWRDLGHQDPVTIMLEPEQKLTKDFLQRVMDESSPAVLIIWDGPESLPALDALAPTTKRPGMVFISSRYIRKNFEALPEQVRDVTFITYPFVFAQKAVKKAMSFAMVPDDERLRVNLADLPLRDSGQIRSNLTLPLTRVLTMALMELRGNYYRDNLLDVIGMIPDQYFPTYERMSFGPGQRYASKGCYIVQLTKGPGPELVKKSDWVIH